MKNLAFLSFFISTTLLSQTNTEVHLFDIIKTEKGYDLINGKNISNNAGYNSQPFFYDDTNILFSSAKNKNTDIAIYNLETKTKRFISNTPNGGEYSPQRIPESNDISAVRLDDDDFQSFYSYDLNTGKNKKLI